MKVAGREMESFSLGVVAVWGWGSDDEGMVTMKPWRVLSYEPVMTWKLTEVDSMILSVGEEGRAVSVAAGTGVEAAVLFLLAIVGGYWTGGNREKAGEKISLRTRGKLWRDFQCQDLTT